MTTSLRRWRVVLAATGLILFLSACATGPAVPPNRTAYPGESADDPIAAGNTAAENSREIEPVPQPQNDIDAALFEATRAALGRGDWVSAQLALPTLQHQAPEGPLGARSDSSLAWQNENPTALWHMYYQARIALQRGDSDKHDAILAELSQRPLPPFLRNEVLLQRLRLAELSQDTEAQLALSHRLLRSGAHPERDAEACEASLWRAAQLLDAEQRRKLTRSADPDLRGWLDLAAANAQAAPAAAREALSTWITRHQDHAAMSYAQALYEASSRDAASTQLTLLVPLSGALEKAGDAVSRGFLAAYYASGETALTIDIVDSRRFSTVNAAYLAATQRGANIVVGPLGKRQVADLLSEAGLSVPVLTLNRPENEILRKEANSLLLSLAPEDEAEQLAEQAYVDGSRRGLLVRPKGVWGDRMESAFAKRWRALGGSLPSRAIYGNASTHSDAIREALGLDQSTQRSTSVREVFNERVETNGRRREDLDAVFLLSKSSEEARALKPMINYHYAGDLPVYSLSTADSGSNSPTQNRDLSDVRLLAMPWRLSDQGLPGLTASESQGSSAALHALGADAFSVARRWWRMASTADPVFSGLTADVYSAPDSSGTLLRRLKTAEFDRGNLLPR